MFIRVLTARCSSLPCSPAEGEKAKNRAHTENACASSSFQAEDVTRKGGRIETAAKKYIEKMRENVLTRGRA